MNVALWIVQGLVALAFAAAGVMKLTQSKDAMRDKMPFVDDFSDGAIRLIGLLEVLGAVGVVLPWLLGVSPWLTPLAALGLALTMLSAAVVHIRRNEPIIINVFLFALAMFVVWGRWVSP
ncbi:MAG: DoxX family protein [Bacteroidota bacterium]